MGKIDVLITKVEECTEKLDLFVTKLDVLLTDVLSLKQPDTTVVEANEAKKRTYL